MQIDLETDLYSAYDVRSYDGAPIHILLFLSGISILSREYDSQEESEMSRHAGGGDSMHK